MSGEPWAVIWDMDGVLVDTAEFHWQAWSALWRDLDLTLDYGAFHATFGQRNPEIIATLLGSDLPPERVAALGKRKEELYRTAVAGRVRALPGVLELTAELAASRVPQAVASSAPLENITLILEELGIGSRFTAIVCDRDVTAGKPNPQVFLVAARRLGVPPDRCVVIEDAVAGVAAARSAGMASLAVANTNPPERLSAASRVVATLNGFNAAGLSSLLRA